MEAYEEMLGEDVSVSFAMGPNESVIITLTTESGKTVTITINNFYPTQGNHRLNINGGTITSTEDELQRLLKKYKIAPSVTSGTSEYMVQQFYHNGSSIYNQYGGSDWPAQGWVVASTTSSEEMSEIERQAEALGYDLDELAEQHGKTKEELIEEIEAALEWDTNPSLESILSVLKNGLETI